jgi:hypothetical protein
VAGSSLNTTPPLFACDTTFYPINGKSLLKNNIISDCKTLLTSKIAEQVFGV